MYSLSKTRGKAVAWLAMASALLWLACGEGQQGEHGGLRHKKLELMDFQTSAPGGWISTGTLAQERNSHVAVLLPSGKVLVAGGTNGTHDLQSAEVYDPDTHSWTAADSMKSPRRESTATVLPSGKVLIAGGSSNGSVIASAEVYDPATNTWSYTTNSMASPRRGHTATVLPDGKVLVTGGYYYEPTWPNWTHHYLNGAEVYDPVANSWRRVASMGAARENHTMTLLPNGQVLVVGGSSNSDPAQNTAEVYDPVANSWTPTSPIGTDRFGHTATVLPNGQVLITGGNNGTFLSSAEVYDPAAKTWSYTSNTMSSPRRSHTATALPSGKVLVAGGNSGTALNTAEVYDPETNRWSSTTHSMASARYWHTATLLSSGKVLIAGGYNPTRLNSAEVYDPALNLWASAESMFSRRWQHTATVLRNGKVLVAGGRDPSSLKSGELYDPATDSWSSITHSMASARHWHTATRLRSGKVLVAGGLAGSTHLNSAELYDPDTGNWSPTINSMTSRRRGHTATVLRNDTVLVVGGFNGSYLKSAEVYNPVTNSWTAAHSMNSLRSEHTATLLPNGKVLVVGGFNGSHLKSAEVYDPDTGKWSPTNTMTSTRSRHTATVLPNGKVLVAGGFDGSSNLRSAEVYDSDTNSWTAAPSMNLARREHAATVLPNGKVLIVGGFHGFHLNHAEVYDPDTGEWNPTDALAEARYNHTATLLPSGMVLVTGGYDSDDYLSSTEKYILTPLVVLTPADGSLTNSRPTYSGTAEPGITVEVIVDGASVGTTTANDTGNWRFQHPAALEEGSHAVKALAKDAVDNITLESNINTFTVDATPPAAPVVLTPTDGLATNNSRPTYSGTAEPGITVEVIVDDATVETTTANVTGNWSFQHTEALEEGSHAVKALAIDAVGNKSPESNINTFTVDITLPAAPVVLTPANGSATSNPHQTYSGKTDAGNKVTVWLGGEKAGETVEADGDGNWTLTPTPALPDKDYEVRVNSMDAAGNISSFSVVQFTVDTVRPEAPKVSVLESFNTQTPIIVGTAEPHSKVTVHLDGTEAEVEANATGAWSFSPATALEFKSYVIFATATDAAGNISPFSTEHTFDIYIPRSHYGWGCTTSPAFPAAWALLALSLLLRRRRLSSP